MKGIEHIADQQTDQKIEEKHEAEEKKRILQKVDDVLDLMYLLQLHPHDMIKEVYQLAYGDGHMAGQQREPEWSDLER